VLSSGLLAQGPRTAALEAKFAEVCGTRYAVATSSGTTALHISLLAHGIGPGDEVITSAFTFFASISSIMYTGAKPVFVDVEEDNFNIDPYQIEAAITPKTKAIMPVHLYGYPCEMDKILEIATQYGLIVIEDAAQAIGARFKNQPVGSFGTGCFSLYATKNVMSGEGGMITTNDDKFNQLCRMIRNHGMQQRYYHDILGYNFRMSDIHAAIGLAQIGRLEWFSDRRQSNASYFNQQIKSVITPKVKEGYTHAWHQFTIRVPHHRDEAIKQLNDAEIGTGVFYPVPAYRQKPVSHLELGDIHLPITERMVNEVISIPVHPLLSQDDLNTIVTEVNKL